MKKIISIVLLVSVLVSGSGCSKKDDSSSTSSVNKNPSSDVSSGVSSETTSAEVVNDIMRIKVATELWVAANTIYSVDDTTLVNTAVGETQIDGEGYYEFFDYEGEVSKVFTKEGIKQLESAILTGNIPLIKKVDGKVYRKSPVSSGYDYTKALHETSVDSISGEDVVFDMSYEDDPGYSGYTDDPDYIATYESIKFTVNFGETNLVKDYRFPGASF